MLNIGEGIAAFGGFVGVAAVWVQVSKTRVNSKYVEYPEYTECVKRLDNTMSGLSSQINEVRNDVKTLLKRP